MPLSDEQKQALRDEEFFREQVRKELAGPKKAPGVLDRVAAFAESKLGFWVLTTVLGGVVATGVTSFQRWVDREAIDTARKEEKARRDLDAMLKLGPLLTSPKPSEASMAQMLLSSMVEKGAIDKKLALDIGQLQEAALRSTRQAEVAPPVVAAAPAQPAASTPVASGSAPAPAPTYGAYAANPLPVHVYVQVASDADRKRAEGARQALRGAGILAPGIEIVGPERSPSRNELRYCADRIDADALARVSQALAPVVSPAPANQPIAARLCAGVKNNQFELWYARNGG